MEVIDALCEYDGSLDPTSSNRAVAEPMVSDIMILRSNSYSHSDSQVCYPGLLNSSVDAFSHSATASSLALLVLHAPSILCIFEFEETRDNACAS